MTGHHAGAKRAFSCQAEQKSRPSGVGVQDVVATVKVFYSLLEDEKLTSAISESERSRREVSNRLVKNVTTMEAETDKVKQMAGQLPKAVLIAIAIVVLIFLTTCISTLRGR
jgi:hypothetical protein